MLCIGNSGDWTKQLHDKIKVPCYRQMYVLGPYTSQFSDTAVTTSNAIAIASDIGITPTLSLVLNYAGKKRINVVWMCREPGLIEYILHKVDISAITKKSYAFIFYTGKRELALPKDLPVNVFIFKCRPHLEHTITGIVTAIHSGEGLPEEMYEAQEKIANAPFHERMKIALCRVVETYSKDEMFEYAVEETEKAAMLKQEAASDASDGTSNTYSLDNDGCDPETPPRQSSAADPKGEVSLNGLNAMISKFLGGIGVYSRSDIEDFFHQIDSDGSGFIDRDEFDEFIRVATDTGAGGLSKSSSELASHMKRTMSLRKDQNQMVGTSRRSFTTAVSIRTFNSILGDDSTVEYMQKLITDTSSGNGTNPLEDWSIFYCGGSNVIKDDLKKISKKYGIDFAVEKFDW
jgi:hypothetical protein